jgi:hypothetical protein
MTRYILYVLFCGYFNAKLLIGERMEGSNLINAAIATMING